MRPLSLWLYRALGAGVAIAIMEWLARFGHHEAARVPFVTSIVLTMAAPEAPPARPYAVVAGHLLSAVAGMLAVAWLGPGDNAGAFGVGLAALLMLLCRALHPPAGIDAFLVAELGLPWSWVANPVLIGAVLLAVFAWLWAAGGRQLFAEPNVAGGDAAKGPRGVEPLT
jgi:CBS-domain-containing membrane protein